MKRLVRLKLPLSHLPVDTLQLGGATATVLLQRSHHAPKCHHVVHEPVSHEGHEPTTPTFSTYVVAWRLPADPTPLQTYASSKFNRTNFMGNNTNLAVQFFQ